MKNILALALALVLVLCCMTPAMAWDEAVTVKVGVVGSSNEMWTDVLVPKLAAENITLELMYFSDYNTPNIALALGEIDINAFQHYNYLAKWLAESGAAYDADLVAIGNTLIAPLSLYSKKYTSLEEIKEGDTVIVMNDVTNEARALRMLESAGLIKLADDIDEYATVLDIVEYKFDLNIVELAADMVASQLDDPTVAVGFLNGQFATQAGFTIEDALLVESYDPNNPDMQGIVNIIAARAEDADNPLYKYIAQAYQCEEVKDVFFTLYKGTYVPAWQYE